MATQELLEVENASERPSNCPIRVFQDGAHSYTIDIPARGAPATFAITVAWLLLCLGASLYSAVRVLIFGETVPIIAPNIISPYLLQWRWLLLATVALFCAVAMLALSVLLKPVFQSERITIDSSSICHEEQILGRTKKTVLLRSNLSAIKLLVSEHGLTQPDLVIQESDRVQSLASNVRLIDREWLHSVLVAIINYPT